NHRPRRERLTQDRIVTETLALIDEQGIALASMRNVGERLGVRAMSLYRYVGNRDELFDAVVDRIVNELSTDPDVPDRPTQGWRAYLDGLAWGVRRYARAHPHAFPLVATRPPGAPWVNPPLRSLRWIENMLSALAGEGFSDEQLLFTYRSFNSFLLGFLLLETSAMTLRDPKPGDGSFQRGTDAAGTDAAESTDPVPGALSPARSRRDRADLAGATTATQRIDPVGEVSAARYPVIHRLRAGLTEDRFEDEFRIGLNVLLDRIDAHLHLP
ncbi:MAG TPA: TetR/AcrR family transcriptional regulator, partial [Jatrophihabitantaceae bacterium]